MAQGHVKLFELALRCIERCVGEFRVYVTAWREAVEHDLAEEEHNDCEWFMGVPAANAPHPFPVNLAAALTQQIYDGRPIPVEGFEQPWGDGGVRR